MDNDKQNILIAKYPKIFKDHMDRMRFGIECNNGWFDILDRCCERIQKICDSTPFLQVMASQIKEKFGTLRFYVHYNHTGMFPNGENEIDALRSDPLEKNGHHASFNNAQAAILDAESESASICEACGAAGCLCKYGAWYHTFCPECATKSNYISCNHKQVESDIFSSGE